MYKSWVTIRRRVGALPGDESGASALFAVVSLMFLVVVIAYVHNVGMTVNRKIRLQNAADAAAFSGAVVEANSLSAIAWLNSCQTYIYARMQEAILEMMPLATAAGTSQWGRHVYEKFKNKPVTLLSKSPLNTNITEERTEIPPELQEGLKDFESQSGSANEERVRETAEKLEQLHGDMEKNVNEKSVKDEQLKAARAKRLELEAQHGELTRKIAKLKRDGASSGEIAAAEAELATLNQQRSENNRTIQTLHNEVTALEDALEDQNRDLKKLMGEFEEQQRLGQQQAEEAKKYENRKPDFTADDFDAYWNDGEIPKDPPPILDTFVFIPIIGDLLSGSKATSLKVRDGRMSPLIEDYPNDEDVPSGAPPWEELLLSMSGNVKGTELYWRAKMLTLYKKMPDSTQDFLDMFKKEVLDSVKTWVGARYYSGGKPTLVGFRPGETWIKQLSIVASSIAAKMPEMIRNEVLYSVSVNASPGTRVALYPDPAENWGKVAFAEYDKDNSAAFFRYDHFATPPTEWKRPPYWTNSYSLGVNVASRLLGMFFGGGDPNNIGSFDFLGYANDLRKNNPALWERDGAVYGNRFLHEARRQNARMRSITIGELAKLAGFNPDSLLANTEFGLAYAEKEEPGSQHNFGYPPHYRMKLSKTFYFDEYVGAPGLDDNDHGRGFALRTAVTGWNKNDRHWAMEREDTLNRSTKHIRNSNWGSLYSPIPWVNKGPHNPNYNKYPRCTLGFAAGSSIPLIGHAAFMRSKGDDQEDDDAADGHWHYEHYHAHSRNCAHWFPNSFCIGWIFCLPQGFYKWMTNGRSQFEGNSHAPYKHWDGYAGDDLKTNKSDGQKALDYHIYCEIAEKNTLSGASKLLSGFHGKDFSRRLVPERVPLMPYRMCIFCKTEKVWFFIFCVCKNCTTTGRHGSTGGAQWVPKDWLPFANTPTLFIDDYNPHWTTMIGAWLTWGDIEGDPRLFFGCGDPYFYDWIYMGLDTVKGIFQNDDSIVGKGIAKILNGATKHLPSVYHEFYPLDLSVTGTVTSLLAQAGMTTEDLDVLGQDDTLKDFVDGMKSESFVKAVTAIADTFYPRAGHHRLLQDPLTMSKCPVCGNRHLGGDWGPGIKGDLLYKALDTGDRRVDGGIHYSHFLKGHDLVNAADKYGKADGETSGAYAYSDLDFDFDIDDGLSGNSPVDELKGDSLSERLMEKDGGRRWTQNFAADRFVREWFAPSADSGNMFGLDLQEMLENISLDDLKNIDGKLEEFVEGLYPKPQTNLAPAVVMTENFFRNGVSVVLMEKYRPIFGVFGSERTMVAVATARAGFIERTAADGQPDDGMGAGEYPQIITGADEMGADGVVWDLDRVWKEFLDFPNHKPDVESNLYYADWGAKLVSTRYAILANAGDGDNPRRSVENRFFSAEDAEIHFWKTVGDLECFNQDGGRAGITVAEYVLPNESWEKYASGYVQTRYDMEGAIQW